MKTMALKPKPKTNDQLDALALDAIQSGVKTNGAVASYAEIGVTAAYQAVERLKQSKQIVQSPTGVLSVEHKGELECRLSNQRY